MKNYKSCIDYSEDYNEPNLDELIDAELAEAAFTNHLSDVADMIETYGDYVGDDV
jgi:hypothetical protein